MPTDDVGYEIDCIRLCANSAFLIRDDIISAQIMTSYSKIAFTARKYCSCRMRRHHLGAVDAGDYQECTNWAQVLSSFCKITSNGLVKCYIIIISAIMSFL